MITLTYTLAFCVACTFFARFQDLQKKILVFIMCAFFCNLPVIFGLSLVEWMDSLLGKPSFFLLFLLLSGCFVVFYAPQEEILPARSKVFIAIFGFVVFMGNLNLLWGFDLYSLRFETQICVLFGFLFFALWVDLFLGILYLLCLLLCLVMKQENLIAELIDISVWLWAVGWLVLESVQKRHKA